MIIIAHRGGAAEAPENTIAAIQRTIDHGIYHFEVDLRLTADDKLVLLHDSNLVRTTGVDRFIDETNSNELAAITVLEQQHPTHIPLLDEVMQSCAPIHSIQLELKSDERTDIKKLSNVVSDWLRDQASTENIIITSFDIELLQLIRQKNAQVTMGVVNKHSVQQALEDFISLNANYLCLSYRLLDAIDDTTLNRLRAASAHISVWTVNDAQRINELKKLGVQSIISDKPVLLSTHSE